jgi:very-short-patch-repair endonuclease
VSANDFEDLLADLLSRHGLSEPRFNADLVVRGHHFKPDCLWSDRMLIVELDGAAVHRTRKAFERDRERDRILLAAGYRTIRITWRQLRDEPDSVVSDIRSALVNLRPTSSPV